ncbi:alpha/beta fold hydrolase [Pacificoceanicola onchidii]|uniref:alpha/beta fold hydrolase n=1 Tax=Pacificoceanicola onchidii TaxID=2562685 RepID=UPI0010A66EA0|nr:alpha/beta hydrolase [Pacificoceanicola onchidii]
MTWITRPRSEIGGLAAIVRGVGPDVLLLHGVGLRAEAWGAQLGALPGRITAPDMPGHGGSALRSDVQMDGYVAAALSVLEALEGPAVVVGHSMGAMLALELALRAPERVRAVAALNGVFERPDAAAEAVSARAKTLTGLDNPDPTPTLERWFGAEASPEREACEGWLRGVDPQGYKQAYTAFASSTLPRRDALQSLQCPALFMTGSEEPNSTPAMSKAMASLAPKGRALIIEGAAHMMPMTHAAEVNAALTELIMEVRR